VVVDGNSVVRDVVTDGEVPVGFTDTDDVNVAMAAGKPVKMIYPDKEGLGTLLIPNTAALIRGAPHPEEGKRLVDYLLSAEVEKIIAFSSSANMPLRDDVERPPQVPALSSIRAMDVDYETVAEKIRESARFCHDLFVR
jgi:iron(III) transport system substrate-binding protein